MKLLIEKEVCIGCGLCQTVYPEIFELKEGLAKVKSDSKIDTDLDEIIEVCPCKAIKIIKKND